MHRLHILVAGGDKRAAHAVQQEAFGFMDCFLGDVFELEPVRELSHLLTDRLHVFFLRSYPLADHNRDAIAWATSIVELSPPKS